MLMEKGIKLILINKVLTNNLSYKYRKKSSFFNSYFDRKYIERYEIPFCTITSATVKFKYYIDFHKTTVVCECLYTELTETIKLNCVYE